MLERVNRDLVLNTLHVSPLTQIILGAPRSLLSLKSLFKDGFLHQTMSKKLKTARTEQGRLCRATAHLQLTHSACRKIQQTLYYLKHHAELNGIDDDILDVWCTKRPRTFYMSKDA